MSKGTAFVSNIHFSGFEKIDFKKYNYEIELSLMDSRSGGGRVVLREKVDKTLYNKNFRIEFVGRPLSHEPIGFHYELQLILKKEVSTQGFFFEGSEVINVLIGHGYLKLTTNGKIELKLVNKAKNQLVSKCKISHKWLKLDDEKLMLMKEGEMNSKFFMAFAQGETEKELAALIQDSTSRAIDWVNINRNMVEVINMSHSNTFQRSDEKFISTTVIFYKKKAVIKTKDVNEFLKKGEDEEEESEEEGEEEGEEEVKK